MSRKQITIADHVGCVTRCNGCGNIAIIAGDGKKATCVLELDLDDTMTLIGKLIEITDTIINEQMITLEKVTLQ